MSIGDDWRTNVSNSIIRKWFWYFSTNKTTPTLLHNNITIEFGLMLENELFHTHSLEADFSIMTRGSLKDLLVTNASLLIVEKTWRIFLII